MRALLEDWNNGWAEVEVGLSISDIDRLIALLEMMKAEPDQHFHATSDFVGAGGIGFQLLTAMNLFQYQTVSFLLIATFVLVACAERVSAWLRGLVK